MLTADATTLLKPITLAELPLCVDGARAFYVEKKLPGDFHPDVFLANWHRFLSAMTATVIGLWESERPVGALGAMVTPDLLDGRLTATEMFWYLDPTHRHGLDAFRLIDAFEAWGDAQGAVEFRMLHMLEPNEDPAAVRLAPIYKRRKYRPLEVGYYKPNPKRS